MKNKFKFLFALSFVTLLMGCNSEGNLNLPEISDNQNNNGNSSNNGSNTGDSTISVTGVSFTKSSFSMEIKSTYTLKATVAPANASNKNVTWSSSNTAVATISDTGVVTGISVGETTITVTTEDGHKTATCKVNVLGIGEVENSEVVEVVVPNDNINDDFAITCNDMSTISHEGNVYTLSPTTELVYSLSGKLNGRIVVDSTARVELDLNNVSITSSENSPIYIANSDDVEIKSTKDTINYIVDSRTGYTDEVEGQGEGAIYSENGDLKFTGKGKTSISSTYYDGIRTKDNLSLKNSQLKITAVNNGIRANDGIEIESGALDIECGNDGLHTKNTDISTKGNQRGNIDIVGGSILINCVSDGLDAAYNVNISGDPAIEIKTEKFSSYSGEKVSGGSNDVTTITNYFRVTSSYYKSGDKFAAYINGTWYPMTFKESTSGRSSYHVFTYQKPQDATSVQFFKFSSSQEYSTTTYTAYSDAKAFSNYGDMITVNSISGSKMSLSSWSTYSSSQGGGGFPGGPGGGGFGPGQEGNTDKAEESAKGIKADNEIHIDGGSIAITAYDDGLHTNCPTEKFENDTYSTGNLYITAGELNISASDDGIHADCDLYISGGTILVSEAYEGIEGNTINISGGDVTVFASDDGVNAASGKKSPAITVSGGRLDETVSPNGDTDGIDSNGTYTQTGGIVIARGPNSMMAAALDTDGAVTLKGGTLILLGSIEKSPSLTNMTLTSGLSGHSTGNHSIKVGTETISYNNKYSYAKTTVYSDQGTAKIA